MASDHDGATRRALLGAAASLAAVLPGPASAQPQPSPSAAGRFAGRVVLVTGAMSGIGEGTKVSFCGRRAELGRQVEAGINADPAIWAAGGLALYVQADVREEAQVARFVQATVERFGTVHIAFNNAGVVFGLGQVKGSMPIGEVPTDLFDDVWMTNTRGVFLAMRHELPVLLRNKPWGRYGPHAIFLAWRRNKSTWQVRGGQNALLTGR